MSTKEITIAGVVFTVSTPYAEGHTITAGEAKALNQTRCENIRNNLAKLVKNEDGSLTADEIAAKVAEYDASYDFTVAAAGSGRRVTDPLEKEITRLAKEVVKNEIAKQGKTVKAYCEEPGGQDRYDAALEKVMGAEKLVKLAKDNIRKKAEAAEAAAGDLGI